MESREGGRGDVCERIRVVIGIDIAQCESYIRACTGVYVFVNVKVEEKYLGIVVWRGR